MDASTLGIGLGGVIIGALAPVIAKMFQRVLSREGKRIVTLDDRIEAWTFERWGFRFPVSWHEKIDSALLCGVAWAEATLGSEEFCRELLHILRGNYQKVPERLFDLLKEWVRKGFPANEIPAEAKSLVNEAKENLAVKVITANLAASLSSSKRPTESQIREDIRAIAPVAGRTVIGSKLATPPILQRTEDVQAEIEALRAKAELASKSNQLPHQTCRI